MYKKIETIADRIIVQKILWLQPLWVQGKDSHFLLKLSCQWSASDRIAKKGNKTNTGENILRKYALESIVVNQKSMWVIFFIYFLI